MQPDHESWRDERPQVDRAAMRNGVILVAVVVVGTLAMRGGSWGQRRIELPQYHGHIQYEHHSTNPVISALLERGAKALEKSDLAEAESAYREIIEKFPRDVTGYECLACTMSYGKRYDESDAEYRRALEINPRSPDSLFGLAANAYRRDRQPEALEFAKQALQVNECWEYHRLLGLIYRGRGDRANALAHFERAAAMPTGRPKDDEAIKKQIEELKK